MKAPSRRIWARAGAAAAVASLASGMVGSSIGHSDPDRAGHERAAMPLERAAVADVAHVSSPGVQAGPRPLSWTPTSEQLGAAATALEAIANGANGTLVSAAWTASTRSQYLAVTGEGSLTDARAGATQVIVLDGTGDFTFTNISVPHGVPLPRGKYVECAFDPVTGSVTDWGTDDVALDRLGPVQALPLGSGRRGPSLSAP